jgi:putative flippase GtrA
MAIDGLVVGPADSRDGSRFAARQAIFLRDAVRYGLASAAALALDWGTLLGLIHVGVPPLVAAAIGFMFGMALTYWLSTAVVFADRRRDPLLKEAAIFVAIGLAGLAVNQLALWIFITQFGIVAGLAKAPVAGLVFSFNFILRRAILFAPPSVLVGS